MTDPDPAKTPESAPRPPERTILDHAERVLLRIIIGAVILLALLLGFASWHVRQQRTANTAATGAATTSISIVVDFGDGAQKRLADLPYTSGMSAMDAMKLAGSHAHPIAIATRGSGEGSLITSIDGIANATTKEGRCWQYWINAQYGNCSAAVATLHAGDRVTWAYRVYESDPKPPPP